jgi:hypothetical protein
MRPRGRIRWLGLAAGPTLLLACTGKLAVMNTPPGMAARSERKTAAECRAVPYAQCDRTPGSSLYGLIFACPCGGWIRESGTHQGLDPYGVQIDLINRRRAELHRVAAGIMGCLPEPVPTKRRRASSVPLP